MTTIEIKLARRLDGTVVGWIAKTDIRGKRRGVFFKHRRAAEFYAASLNGYTERARNDS